MKKLLFILIALLQLKVALAQTFPVRITPQAIPPYPTNLSGYANSGITNSPLRVQLVLSDVTASSREVRLAVAIEGNGINAISAPVVIGAPTLILDGGIPLNLTISELAPYFEQQNLQGISSVQYNSPLPDGSYRFCFEVFDAFTGNRLSSKNCATIFLINNDPPFLNKPDNQAKISEQNPTNIIFQWTPRHINVPNVSYEFSLVEVWDPYIDPQAIFVASPPLYQEVTTNTSLLYGPVQPLLLAGKRYAWRVRAFATNNGEEVSVFNNNGNSEIFWFDYQANCELPSNIQVQDVSMTNATISWIGHPDHLDYTIKYREAGSDRWYSKTTPRDYVTIDEFKADTVYEYRVVGNCTQNSFGESPVDTFRTLSEELADYASCGIQPDPVDLSNQELLTELFVNDVFTAGDFPVYVKEVSGSTSFTGEGYISTPWLATVRIPVKFENIKINTEMKLVDGFVVTTYDPNWGSIVDGDVIIDTILGDDGDVQVIDVDVDITNIEIDENGDIIIITSDGPIPDTFDGGNDIIFVDNTGEEWHVDADGDVSKGEQAEGGPANSGNTDGVSSGGVNEITAAGITVTFNNTNGFYSFDTVPENAGGSIANEYDKVPISGGGEYNIPYKAIAALPDHPTDFVTAEVAISTNDHSASDIIFKTKEGTKVQATWDRDSTTATLSLKKAFDFAKQQIIATVRPKDSTDKYKVAGAANLWHLANQDVATINVKLISVNGASLSGIGERINKIYNPAGVQFNVTSASPLTVSDTTLDVGDSSLLSQYTEGEKTWISQFKTLPGYQRDTYYLFVTDIPPSDSGTEGFMPLKRQFGFVFTGDDKGRTAAHELGHGVFGLEHPFKKYNTTGTTDLLMDYGTGVRLSHMDWEKMHAPGIQIYWFQGDEDGENTIVSKIPKEFANSDGTFTFLTVNGNFITLPKEAKNLSFVTGIDKLNPYIIYPTGALQSFKLGGKTYSALIEKNLPEGDLNIESFGFTYKGFKNYDQTGKDNFYNSIITLVPDGNSRKLLKVSATDLTFNENEQVNILKSNTYEKFQKLTLTENRLLEKKYSYSEPTPYDPSFKLNQSLVQHFLGKDIAWNSKYFIVSKLAFLNNSYPELVSNSYKELKSTTDISALKNSIYTSEKAYSVLMEQSVDTDDIISIYLDIINKVRGKFSNCLETLSNITSTTPLNQVINCVRNLSDNELKEISIDDKITALSILTNWNVVTNDNTEIEIIRLLKFTKDSDIENLFEKLKGKSKVQEDKFILKRLVYKIDNDHTWLTEDNYREFIKTISTLALKSDTFKRQALDYTDEEFINYNINFYHRSFWDGVFEIASLSSSFPYLTCNPDTTTNWKSDDSVTITIQNSFSCNLTELPTTDPLDVDPFAPIWFVNKSSLSMLSDYNKTPVLSPAIIAYYANNVGDTKNIIDGIEATIDVASLATGYGALSKAPSALRKAYIIADMVGSGVNLTLTSSSENLSPNAKAVLESLNVLTAVIAIGELSDGVKNLKTLFTKAKQNTKPLPSKDQVNNFLDRLLDDKVTPDEIAEIGANKIEEAKGWLRQIEAEGKVSNSTDLALKARRARAKLLLIANLSDYKNIVARGFDLEEVKIAFKNFFPDNPSLEKTALDLFEQENFDELFDLFKANDINNWNGVIWPPMDGFRSIDEIKPAKEYIGESFDRFQASSNPSLGGSYVSPIEKIAKETGDVDEIYFTYDSRMLADNLTPGTYYFKFDLSDKVSEAINLTTGEVAPWFKTPASISGKQVKASIPFHKMDANSFENISIEQIAPDKTWRKCIIEGTGVVTELQEVVNNLPKELADDLVDYINKSDDTLKLFKEANPSKLDKLIEAFKLFRKHNIETPTCK
ncbi:hypothetical protein GCM10009430_12500 [Aquimarina litoralis]|uniref:Fibronectin type-III domain-containing protein n=1 Tax=Aquimarina litoralis TaxID=584605 RepID=A0ABP3TVL0_9FLAO